MKSEKPGAIIYYKHLEILEEAGLNDEQIGKVLRAAIKYDETGVSPEFASPLSAFFIMIKYDLDANRKKYEEIKLERSRVGRLGGRPSKKANESNGFDDSKTTNRFSDEVTPTFPSIRDEARKSGYFIDKSIAQKIGDCGLPAEWLQSPHSFFDLATERVLENKKYCDLPYGEQKALFITAVRSWDDLREEYPEWKARKERQDREMEIEAARDNRPQGCRCGGELKQINTDELFCFECGDVAYTFDEKSLVWTYIKNSKED